MTSFTECQLFHRTLTLDDISKKPQYKNIKFKRAFQFLQLLLLQRVYGIDVITCSSIRRSSKKQHKYQFEVFLGGSCNPTTWRHEQAIPYFQSRCVSYYNPQVANWTPDLVEIEHQAKALAPLLFFVIDHDTRSLAAIAEVGYLAARGRNIIVVMSSMPEDRNHTKFIQQKNHSNEVDNQYDYENVREARRTLRVLLQSINIPVFDNVRIALECAAFILETTKRTMINNSNEDNRKRGRPFDEIINSSVLSITVIRSLSNKTSCESPDEFSQQMISVSNHRRHSATPATSTVRPPPSLNPFLRSINFTTGLHFRLTPIYPRIQTSCSTNESDDDGYDSLVSSNRTLSLSSSSISSDIYECPDDHPSENNPTGSYLSNIISIFSSYIPFVKFVSPLNSTVTESIFGLCTLPFRFIKNALLPSIPSVEEIVQSSDGSNHLFDLYIASGDYDKCWINTFALPLVEEMKINYTKRQSSHESDQLDVLYDIHIRKRSRLLYYLINDNERLSQLTTELAFLIGEHKYHIIVCLQPSINENSEKILTKNERQDLERSRKYLEDFARRENIVLYHSREQSWQHVLTFFLHD